MVRLRVRWAEGSDDKPAPGEALARLVPVGYQTERHPGQGAVAPSLVVSAATGEASWEGPPGPTDLHIGRVRLELSVETSDGRRLAAHFGPDAAAPQIDSTAGADLRAALNRAWYAKGSPGRWSEQGARIAGIIDKAAELIDTATRLSVAQALGRVTDDGLEPASQYKEDVRAAGGWAEIMSQARART